jgi:hypothetical protein
MSSPAWEAGSGHLAAIVPVGGDEGQLSAVIHLVTFLFVARVSSSVSRVSAFVAFL